jgi:cysteinyl-tRNA synthetase
MKKMSKSIGNIQTVPELILDGHSAEYLRFALINSHYRSKLAFSTAKIEESKKAIHRINETYNRLQNISSKGKNQPQEYEIFLAALADDLNTPKALGVLFNYLRDLNRRLDNDNLSVSDASKGLLFIETADIIFSFIQEASSLPDDVADLVSKRERAREEKNWLLSDKLRDELKDRGWIVEDTSDGSKCYRV